MLCGYSNCADLNPDQKTLTPLKVYLPPPLKHE